MHQARLLDVDEVGALPAGAGGEAGASGARAAQPTRSSVSAIESLGIGATYA